MRRSDKIDFVFIVTYGRSRSTLLQGIVNSIEGYCIRGENEGLTIPLLQFYAMAKKARFEHGRLEHPVTHPWHGAENIDLVRIRQQIRAILVESILRPPAGTRVTGFKEIRYTRVLNSLEHYLDLMSECFPRSKFLLNTRNIDDVISSGSWRKRAPDEARKVVSRFNELAVDIASRREDCFHFNHDDGDNRNLARLFAFLREPYNAAKLKAVLQKRHSTKTERSTPSNSGDDDPVGRGSEP